MKTTALLALVLLTAGPALAHTAAIPHAHGETTVWPVLVACGTIALAAISFR